MPGARCGQAFRDYEDVRAHANAVASGLAALGVEAGDRVALYLHNDIAFIEASVGIGILGAIPVPANWHWGGAELAYLLDDGDSKMIFAHTSRGDAAADRRTSHRPLSSRPNDVRPAAATTR